MNYELSLIAPALNEEQNIIPFCQMVQRDLVSRITGRLQVVFIDDGSTDGTFKAMKQAMHDFATSFDITAVRFSRNFGKEAAMLAGLQRGSGSYLAFIDVDLQQPASDVANMLDILKASPDADCVAAYAKSRKQGAATSWLSSKFYGVLGKSSHMDVLEDASDFRVFNRNVADALISMPEYHRFSKGLFAWVGFITIPYEYEPQNRHAGETNWNIKSLAAYALNGLLSFTTAPLRVATYAGLATSLLAGLYLVAQIIQRLTFGADVPGYATIVVLILFFGGLQMVMLGILGEYLGRLYIESKRRPIFLIKEMASTQGASNPTAEEASNR